MPPLPPTVFRALALLLLAPLGAAAQPRPQDAAVLAGACVNCHAPQAPAGSAIPSLQGRSSAELLQRLRAFKAGQAPGSVMERLARGHDDAQLRALAEWLAAQGGRP